MTIRKRIFVSMPADRWLTPTQNDLKWAIVEKIERLGYGSEVFLDPRGRSSIAAGLAWNPKDADSVMRRCSGIALLGFPRWTFSSPASGTVELPTDYSHYEGAIAYTLRLPMLVLAQEQLTRRVVFENGYGGFIGEFPRNAGPAWLKGPDFRAAFNAWKRRLDERRDVFLGYCSSSAPVARRIKKHLEDGLDVRVLDWRTDFSPGRTILDQISEAADRCSAGIFLFTCDDRLAASASGRKAAPRDNVVFEAGYFIQAKGKDRVLIIREEGAKMPADLGGDIYVSLERRNRLASVLEQLGRFTASI